MIEPTELYTVADVAKIFKVSTWSVYQSMPDATCRVKLGRKMPEPLRFGKSIRWTGQQLLDFINPPKHQEASLQAPETSMAFSVTNPAQPAKRGPGRPRNSVLRVQ